MSHFTVVEIEATDASCLIDALEACGYKGKIEAHDRPVALIGYDGRLLRETFSLVPPYLQTEEGRASAGCLGTRSTASSRRADSVR